MVLERIDNKNIKEKQKAHDKEAAIVLGREMGAKLDEIVSGSSLSEILEKPLNYQTRRPIYDTTIIRVLDEKLTRNTDPIDVRVRLVYPSEIDDLESDREAELAAITFPRHSEEIYILSSNGYHWWGNTEEAEYTINSNLQYSIWDDSDFRRRFKVLPYEEAIKLQEQVVVPVVRLLDPEHAATPVPERFVKAWHLPPQMTL